MQCAIHMISRKPRSFISLFLNVTVLSSLLFCYLLIQYNPHLEILNEQLDYIFTSNLYIFVSFSFFVLLYSVVLLHKGNQKPLATLLLLGIRPGQWRGMLIIKTFCIGGMAVGLGLVLGAVFNWIFLYFLKQGMKFFDASFYFSWQACGITVISFFLLFFLVASLAPWFTRSRPWIQRLDIWGRVEGQSEPPMGYLRIIFSFCCLGAVGYICFFSDYCRLIVRGGFGEIVLAFCFLYSLLLGLILAVFGIYFFYRQGGVFLASEIRWNRRFSWKGLRLLWMGGMVQCIRGHSRFFFCLSTMMMLAFFSIGLVVGLWKPVFSTDQKYSFEISISGQEGRMDPEDEKMERKIRNFAAHAGWQRVTIQDLYLNQWIKRADPGQQYLEELRARGIREVIFKDHNQPMDTAKLLQYTEGRYSSVQGYNEVQKREDLPPLFLQGRSVAVDCMGYKEKDCRRYAALYPLPAEFGVQNIEYVNTGMRLMYPGSLGFLAKEAPKWIFGDQVFSAAAEYPGIVMEQVSYYYLPSMVMNSKRMDQMAKIVEIGHSRENVKSDSRHDNLHGKWMNMMIFISAIMVSLAFLFISGNFLLLRMRSMIRGKWQRFRNLLFIGCSFSQVRKLATRHMAFLWFLPMFLSTCLSGCFLGFFARFFTDLFESERTPLVPLVQVMGIFIALQVAVFFIGRLMLLRWLDSKIVK